MAASERTALYRLFAVDKALLYVGVSNHFGRRWEQHAKLQTWWPDVDHQTVHWYASREDALLAEKIAIREEAPIHNIQDSPWEKRVKDDGTGFYVVPKPPRVRVPTPNDRHRYPRHYFRPDPVLYEAAKAILAARGQNVNDYLEECLRELVDGQADKPPQRPGPSGDLPRG